MTAAELAALPDALWGRFSFDSNGVPLMMQGAFREALREYGEAVRKRDAEICGRPKPECCGRFERDDNSLNEICCGKYEPGEYMDGPDCAAAIREAKLP